MSNVMKLEIPSLKGKKGKKDQNGFECSARSMEVKLLGNYDRPTDNGHRRVHRDETLPETRPYETNLSIQEKWKVRF